MSLGKGIFKSVLVIAPIAGLMIWYVWNKQSQTDALVERDTQRFEEHFNQFVGSLDINKGKQGEFETQAKEAAKKAEEAQKEVDMSKGTLDRAKQEFNRVMAEDGKIYGDGQQQARPAGTTPRPRVTVTPAK